MCGIYSQFNSSYINLLSSYSSVHKLFHRGPDGLHVKQLSENIILAHSRLSINDLQGGDQPLTTSNENITLVANAEIYNSDEILNSAKRIGFSPLTRSDCEAIIAAYLMYGPSEMHSHIRGMYSFVLFDASKNVLMAARDHVGIKPLYYNLSDFGTEFSSEAKAFSLPGKSFPFPNGHYVLLESATAFNPQPYPRQYNLQLIVQSANPIQFEPASFSDNDIDSLMLPFKKAFRESVKLRFQSDVPICLFLSGGLDSAVLASVINDLVVSGEVPTIKDAYCIGRENSADYFCASEVAELYNWNLHRVDFSIDEAVDTLPFIIYHLESTEPEVIRSSVTNYFLAKRAAQDYKVVLTGEGSDELFGGYLYFHECTDSALHVQELTRIINGLSHANLCRVDKMAMAHSLEPRVPFLDPLVIKEVMRIPSEYKMVYNSCYSRSALPSSFTPFSIEKWILRRAFRDTIPLSILNRAKAAQCEGYSESFTKEFQAAIQLRYNHLITDHDSDYEAQIYTSIYNSFFSTSLNTLTPVRWPGDCRASSIGWSSQNAVNKGLAPSAAHLWRGIVKSN